MCPGVIPPKGRVIVQVATFTERTAWGRNIAAPVRDFLNTESSGAIALLLAAVAALAWSNSPWSDSYESLWTTDLSVAVGDHGISLTLREWVSDGLMTLFFLVVGLEARRELDTGALRQRSRIALAAIAAIGGAAIPALIYTAVTAGGPGAHAWG
jgi:Na+/H+ antiporter NhaA